MKKLYFLFSFIAFSIIVQAQYMEDFESFTVGSYLGTSSPRWTTWSGTPGGADDVKITNTDAHSGTKSVYFESTSSGGGPQDVVLLFDSLYKSGELKVDMWMKVDAGKGAYFNFQGDVFVGSIWALNVYFLQTGTLLVQDDANATKASTTYPPGTWFKLTFDMNFTTNDWKLLVNDTLKGSWGNPINKVASIDFFPYNSTTVGGNGLSGFYIDDIELTSTPFVLPARDGALQSLGFNGKLVGKEGKPYFTVKNIGTDTLKSFDVTIDYNNTQITNSFTSAIPYQATADFVFPVSMPAVVDTMTAILSNVNGVMVDMNPADDTMRHYIDQLVTPQPDKLIIAEMVTGTSYGWGPKGIVVLSELMERYPEYIKPINIHYGDIMENQLYYQGMSSLITQYPSALVNRTGLAYDPSYIETEFLDQIAQPATAVLSNSSSFINDKSKLSVDVIVDFKTAATGNWGVVLVITEDEVTGASPDYDQLNNYSFEAFDIPWSGAGLNWQQQPDTVPASVMVYDHVARYISPDFAGKLNIFPSSINAGDTFHVNFLVNIDSTLNLSKFNVISMLLKPDGTVDNAATTDLSNTQVIQINTGISSIDVPFALQVYPNPAKENATARITLSEPSIVGLTIFDITGNQISKSKNHYGQGTHELSLDMKQMAEGIYFVHVKVNEQLIVKKLIVTR